MEFSVVLFAHGFDIVVELILVAEPELCVFGVDAEGWEPGPEVVARAMNA